MHLGKYGKSDFMSLDLSFYKGKKVLVTGHTGFKGTWLCKILINAGAKVIGYSLKPDSKPNLFEISGIENNMVNIFADICDFESLSKVFEEYNPEIIFHLAAQPIVRKSYKNPRYTYETNVMGTVNIMECIRLNSCVKSVLNVTTDKVYHNNEWCWGYRENEPLDGFDPYSNSKSCSELVTHSYKNSFFNDRKIAVSTARAGNVIGGGDFSVDRIIPDCVRAVSENKIIFVRNPHSIRPYQHVLEPLTVYLEIAEKQYKDLKYQGYYNVGPDDCDCITTGDLVSLFCKYWEGNASWETKVDSDAPHEANFLKLDCNKLKSTFDWKPKWHIEKSIEMVCKFSKIFLIDGVISSEMDKEINEFLNWRI
jgi:CDP-glucose 4,6-dehydratase